MTFNRVTSLERLLKSLQAADYAGDKVELRILIDYPSGSATETVRAAWQRTVQRAQSTTWAHGPLQVVQRDSNHGLARQWLAAWTPTSDTDAAVILEDDLEVSPLFYRWLKEARRRYLGMPELAGLTLQKQGLINRGGQGGSIPGQLGQPYLTPLPGSWGFAPVAQHWRAFLEWYRDRTAQPGYLPDTPGLVTWGWYQDFHRRGLGHTMWTQWFIKYADEHKLYTLYPNVPGQSTLVVHWREAGEHFSEADAAAYRRNPERPATSWQALAAWPAAALNKYSWGMVLEGTAAAPAQLEPCAVPSFAPLSQ